MKWESRIWPAKNSRFASSLRRNHQSRFTLSKQGRRDKFDRIFQLHAIPPSRQPRLRSKKLECPKSTLH
jgi:hypothetical protein